MPPETCIAHELDSLAWADLQRIVRSFRHALRCGEGPELETYLSGAGAGEKLESDHGGHLRREMGEHRLHRGEGYFPHAGSFAGFGAILFQRLELLEGQVRV